MKQKLIIFLLFTCCGIKAYGKDSTLVFKISTGINYSLPAEPEPYNHPWFSHSSNGYEKLTNSQNNTGFSPIIKAGAHKMFGKHTGILLQLSYDYSWLNYTKAINTRSYSNPVEPANNLITEINSVADSRIHRNRFILAFGPVFHLGHFYVSPKINTSVTFDITRTNGIYQKSVTPPYTLESHRFKTKTRDEDFLMAAGLLAGYDFRIGKQLLFIELQSGYDIAFNTGPRAYHKRPAISSESTLSNFKTALTLGMGF